MDLTDTASAPLPWDRPLGATPQGDGRVTFRVWAPGAGTVAVRLGGSDHPLERDGAEELGVWASTLGARHGDRYEVVLDGGDPLPDPATRWQPDGLRGPSAVVDPSTWSWSSDGFTSPSMSDLVLYELHIGTFTEGGTFDDAIEKLPALAELGVTAVEVLPVAEFPGTFGWGYDGVYLSATQSSYGGPDAFQRFVDAAHAAGLAVVLDVVYNHVGASGGDALRAFGPYFTDKYSTFWGDALNYDDECCDPVREWVLQSAEGWIRDLRVDGLRLDAIHAIYDGGANHLCKAIADRVHAANPRAVVIAESGMNDPKVIRPAEEGGWGHDGQWADDLHHALRVLLTGDAEGYYAEFGSIADLAKTYRRPFLHDGQYSTFRKKRFGAPAGDRPPEQFVVFTTNHDQTGNRALGDRPPHEVRRLAAFAVLLSPFVPMLFMGEEHGEDAPFQFFADHIDEEIAVATREGRRREFASFAAFAGEEVPDPIDRATFERSKLTWVEDPSIKQLYRDLLALRRDLPAGDVTEVAGDEDARWFRARRGDVDLCMNFHHDKETRVPCTGSQVLLATHEGTRIEDGAVVLPPRAGAAVR